MEIRSDLPVLVAFKVGYHVLVSLLSFEEVFPEANFGLCCCTLTGTCKKKLKSLLGIFFLSKALDGSSAHVWTKPCLFPCAWAISPCIFKLRTVRFEWLFQTLNTVSLRLRAEMVKLFRVLWCICCTAGQQAHNSVTTVIVEQVSQSLVTFDCFLVMWKVSLREREWAGLPVDNFHNLPECPKLDVVLQRGHFQYRKMICVLYLHPFFASQYDDWVFFGRLI